MAMKDRVKEAVDRIRPALQADGGNIEFVDVDEKGIVKVRLTGACHGCPMAQLTLKNVVEQTLKREIPEVTSVVSV